MKIIIVTFGDWLIKYLDLLEKYLQVYSGEFLKKSNKKFEEEEYIFVMHGYIQIFYENHLL